MRAEWIPSNLVEKISGKFPEEVLGTGNFRGETTLIIRPDALVRICRALHDDPEMRFEFLSDIYSVDYPDREKRFSVVYLLKSITHHHRLRLRADIPEKPGEIESVYPVWRAAGFLEREVYDLMGIRFLNHPDLRRIFMPEDFDGHPLRKEYPVEGKGWRNTNDFIPIEDIPVKGGSS
ncbi:MAG TPA: NADH-quinone oxidoreductase subunit C [Nitrospiria bacterium]